MPAARTMGRSAQPPAAELAEKWKDQKWQKDDWQKDDPERGTVFRPKWADKKIGIDGNRLRTDGNRRMNRLNHEGGKGVFRV